MHLNTLATTAPRGQQRLLPRKPPTLSECAKTVTTIVTITSGREIIGMDQGLEKEGINMSSVKFVKWNIILVWF